MRRLVPSAILLAALGVAGCGGTPSTVVDNAPLTEEQKAEIKRHDQEVEDSERSNISLDAANKKKAKSREQAVEDAERRN